VGAGDSDDAEDLSFSPDRVRQPPQPRPPSHFQDRSSPEEGLEVHEVGEETYEGEEEGEEQEEEEGEGEAEGEADGEAEEEERPPEGALPYARWRARRMLRTFLARRNIDSRHG
jgi:hypothetical protein